MRNAKISGWQKTACLIGKGSPMLDRMLILFLLLPHPCHGSRSSGIEGPTGADEINVWLECKVEK
jgi:hypothetical protein